MAPKLYMIAASPAVRAVLICARSLGVELELIEVNLLNGEHLTPNFMKINPLHTVPTLVDEDGFVICDSHVIMGYLVDKYGKDKSLYPSDLKKRAIIDQRLHFDSSVLFARGLIASKGVVFKGLKEISQESVETIKESYGFLESLLVNNKWVAGDELSVADFSIVATTTSWDVLVPVEESRYPKITAWMKQMKKLPCYGANVAGLEMYRSLIKSKLSD